jgi:Uma2 family endonuclease
MSTIVIQDSMCIPDWVRDQASFRRWARSDEFPERGLFSFLKGDIWVDVSMERLAHNKLKGEIGRVLGNLVTANDLGEYLPDRMMLTNEAAELSTEPDGMFLSFAALESGRVRTEEGEDSVEVEGTPDMVLEVISPHSVRKDTVVLRELYWDAGVPEYWLVDPRVTPVRLDILRRTSRGYSTARRQEGWLKSAVFGCSVQLTQTTEHDRVKYTLEVR